MTERNWEGKFKDGKKVNPVRIALLIKMIETVNKSVQHRQESLDFSLTEPAAGTISIWGTRLIWETQKYVLASLLHELPKKFE
jgi:hypothetical protein